MRYWNREPNGRASRSRRSLNELRALRGKDVWLIGSSVVSAFLDEGEIDEFNLLVVPIFIGQGIGMPLVQARHWPICLKLLASESFRDGVMYLKYGVKDCS